MCKRPLFVLFELKLIYENDMEIQGLILLLILFLFLNMIVSTNSESALLDVLSQHWLCTFFAQCAYGFASQYTSQKYQTMTIIQAEYTNNTMFGSNDPYLKVSTIFNVYPAVHYMQLNKKIRQCRIYEIAHFCINYLHMAFKSQTAAVLYALIKGIRICGDGWVKRNFTTLIGLLKQFYCLDFNKMWQ